MPVSPRPEIILDQFPTVFGDPAGAQVAPPQTLVVGRSRVVFALPLNEGPRQLSSVEALVDEGLVGDPQGNVIGRGVTVWVMRMLTATVTWDTRRL